MSAIHDVALVRKSETCCTQIAEIQDAKKSPSGHHRTTLSGYNFATKAHIDSRKKLTAISPHTSSKYGELLPTSGWDRFVSLGHPSKFQRVTRLGFVTASTSHNGSQRNFARCLAFSWHGTLYIHFGGCCPVTDFARCKFHLALRSPVMAAPARHSSSGRQHEKCPLYARAFSLSCCCLENLYLYFRAASNYVWKVCNFGR